MPSQYDLTTSTIRTIRNSVPPIPHNPLMECVAVSKLQSISDFYNWIQERLNNLYHIPNGFCTPGYWEIHINEKIYHARIALVENPSTINKIYYHLVLVISETPNLNPVTSSPLPNEMRFNIMVFKSNTIDFDRFTRDQWVANLIEEERKKNIFPEKMFKDLLRENKMVLEQLFGSKNIEIKKYFIQNIQNNIYKNNINIDPKLDIFSKIITKIENLKPIKTSTILNSDFPTTVEEFCHTRSSVSKGNDIATVSHNEERSESEVCKYIGQLNSCSICLETFNKDSGIKTLNPCGHVFCSGCCEHLFMTSKVKCPCCRTEVVNSLPIFGLLA